MKEISLKISDIDCAACVERLNRAISAVNGVRDAAVNYASGRALISYNEDEASIASIAAAVKKAGFGVPADSVELKCPALDAETMSRALAALRAMDAASALSYTGAGEGYTVRRCGGGSWFLGICALGLGLGILIAAVFPVGCLMFLVAFLLIACGVACLRDRR